MKQYCLVHITIPGTLQNIKDSPYVLSLKKDLEEYGIKSNFIDTVPGWGNLNQDWLEFSCDMDTDWEWCSFYMFDDDKNHYYKTLFEEGKLLMMINYKTEEGYSPHY